MKHYTFDQWVKANPEILAQINKCQCLACSSWGGNTGECKTVTALKGQYAAQLARESALYEQSMKWRHDNASTTDQPAI